MAIPYYFATDGSWGLAEDIVLVYEEDIDPHLFDLMDSCYDSNRSKFVEWFKENDHEPTKSARTDGFSNGLCAICDGWEVA